VLDQGSDLELIAKDGFVFYNDRSGDRAGVIRFDGNRWRPGKSLHKYNPTNNTEGLLVPGGDQADPPKDKSGNDPKDNAKSNPADPTAPNPGQDGTPPLGLPDPGSPPDEGGPPGPTPGPGPGPGPGPAPTPSLPPVIQAITWSPDPAVRGEPVTFTGTVANAQDATWLWTITAADGSPVHTGSDVGGFSHTFQPGQGDTFEIRLEVTGPGGAARPMTRQIQTTSSVQPRIGGPTASDRSPGVGQAVTFSATEPAAGTRGQWVWNVSNIDTGADVTGPVQRPALQDFRFTFDSEGRYRVRLTVSYDGASDQKAVDVTVSNRCGLERVGGSTLDLRRSGSSDTARVRLTNCFVPQTVTVAPDGWLGVSDSSFTLAPGDTGSVTVRVDGTPPQDGDNPNALSIRLGGGSQVNFDVQANLAPVWNNYAECLGIITTDPTHFFADFVDADVSSLVVTLRVGSSSWRMNYVNGGPGGHGEFFALDVPRGDLPDVSTWQVQATDAFGLDSDIGTGRRGTCW
jgi:hypothetical protein